MNMRWLSTKNRKRDANPGESGSGESHIVNAHVRVRVCSTGASAPETHKTYFAEFGDEAVERFGRHLIEMCAPQRHDVLTWKYYTVQFT